MRTTLLYTTIFLLASCGGLSEDHSTAPLENELKSNLPNPGSVNQEADNLAKSTEIQVHDRKFIWKAELEYLVANLDKATEEIQTWCSQHKAFVADMKFVSNEYQMSNSLIIRVENDHFQPLIKRFKGQASFVDHFDISSEDVTEEYVDIESRLKTKREVRDRYIEVLRNKASNVKEILAAEEAIRVITEEIEVIEGRLRFLNDRVSYSTIHLTIRQQVKFQEHPELYEKTYGSKLIENASEGWNFITELFLGIVVLWPLWIVLFVFWWKGRWLWGKFIRRGDKAVHKPN